MRTYTITTSESDDSTERAEEQVRQLAQALSDAKADLREMRGAQVATRRAPRECGCGCGQITGGGTFCPGHDAKLRSRLLARIDEDAPDGDGALALAELRAAGDKLAHGVGEWRIGSKRREREQKDARAAQAQADKLARQQRADADKSAAAKMQDRSRAETNKASESAADRKRAQIAAAKAAGTVTVPSGK